MKPSFLLWTFIFINSLLSAQSNSAPSVFVDCTYYCDMNYIKQEIPFVNYTLERMDADVYIQVTNLSTGGGGSEVQLQFQGNSDYLSMRDTIKYFVDPNATESIIRSQMVSKLKEGLLPFVLLSPIAENITYTISTPEEELDEDENEKDPWNYWVFNVGGNGWMNGEKTNSSLSLNFSGSANRVTEENKFLMSSNYGFNQNIFKLADGEVKSIQEYYNFNLTYVKSITDHWSVGGTGYAGSSTFGNRDFSASAKAAVEYNIYPYDEAQTRRWTFKYNIGPEYYDYTDSTIYDKLTETVVKHNMNMEFSHTHKKGDLYLELGASQMLHDATLYSIYINPSVSWQLVKGLSVNMYGYFSFINDRINIAKSDFSDSDILLQIKQQDTQFSYYTSFGLNYRFGSTQNNFVNARF